MILNKRWISVFAALLLLPTTLALGAVQLKFSAGDLEGDAGWFNGTNPTNYNIFNWDEDLKDNGEALGLVPNTLDGVNGQNIADAVDFVTGSPTGISLTITSATGWNFIEPNTDGTSNPGAPASNFFDGEATDTSLFGHTNNFNVGSPRPLVEYTLAGLSPTALYDFTFFAARFGAAENRETQYDVEGANSGVAFLDPRDNNDQVAQVLQAQPNSSGELTLTIQPGPNNANSSGFFYLAAFEILENGMTAGQAGDFDDDLDVDGEDFLIWQRNTGVGSLADWQTNYGVGTSSAATAVPEPASALFLLFGLLGTGRMARSRSLSSA